MDNYENNILSDLLGFENDNEKLNFQKEILSLKFIKVIENYLNQNRIKRKEFAKQTGFSSSYISQVFNATKFVNMDFLVKAQNALELPFDVKLGEYDCSPMDVVYNKRHDQIKSKNNYSTYSIDYKNHTNEELLEG